MNADDQTPYSLACRIINLLDWDVDEVVLEPAKGDGAFYHNLPGYVKKHWCEINEGRDFFEWNWPVDTVITNPPFRDFAGGNNLVIPFLEKSFSVARKRVVFLVNHHAMNACKPNRLHRYESQGWVLSTLGIFSVRKWWGLYYLWVFVQGGRRGILWDEVAYE
jgi:hypothetical protein